jgi:hypothetical protein
VEDGSGGAEGMREKIVLWRKALSRKSLHGALPHCPLNYMYGDFTVKCMLCIKQVSLSRPDCSSLENPQKLHIFERINAGGLKHVHISGFNVTSFQLDSYAMINTVYKLASKTPKEFILIVTSEDITWPTLNVRHTFKDFCERRFKM